MPNDPASDLKARLRIDLRAAMKARNATEARVIRSLVAAIDNAEAPSVLPGPAAEVLHQFAHRTAEVERLRLTGPQVHGILLAEIQERERASAAFDLLGKRDHATVLSQEARVIRRYLD